MGQLTPRSNEDIDLGGIGGGLFMEQCSSCGAPVTIVGSLPAVILCPRCAAAAKATAATDADTDGGDTA